IVAVLIAGGEGWRPTSTDELRDAGYFVCSLGPSGADVQSAAHWAGEIHNYLTNLPYRFRGTGIAKARWAMEARPAQSIDPFEVANSIDDDLRFWRQHAPESRRVEPQFDRPVEPSPGRPREPVPGGDIFFDVLVSLKSILSPDQFEV